ncbi:sensor domain-containing protein [Mycobacterium sp. UM_Kg1]|uniref:sensor domain-containing protein n=1 Tax=Mycobacterium sp. UM_Kg1 TaxID=1545691 RepID=UPI00061AD0A8|nr:sensor domain-containing protein [Mycobacterium sp. UM_Kg1]
MSEPHGPSPDPYRQDPYAPMNRPFPPPGGGPFPPPLLPPGLGMPPPPRRPGRAAVLVATACVIAVIGVGLAVVLSGRDRHHTAKPTPKTPTATSTAAAASPDRPPVPVAKIEGLLPRQEVLAAAVADPDLGLVVSGDAMDDITVVDADCQGISSVASGPVYAGSGWTAIRWQRWYSPADIDTHDLKHGVLVSVATFPRAENARAFYTKQSEKWKRCAGRTLNMTVTNGADEQPVFWTITEVTESGEVIRTTAISEGGGGWSCQDALTVRNNVIAQADVCGDSIPANAAQDILGAIAPQVDAAG